MSQVNMAQHENADMAGSTQRKAWITPAVIVSQTRHSESGVGSDDNDQTTPTFGSVYSS